MNIVCAKGVLNKAVNSALSVVSNKANRNTVQGLDGFLLTANKENGTLDICGYDLEKGVKITVSGEGVEVGESGTVIVNAAKFSSVIKNLPDGNISIAVNSSFSVDIKSNKSEIKMHGLSGEVFPLMPELKGENGLNLPRKILRNMILATLFCVGNNNSRPSLNGMLFEIKDNQLSIVASDRNILAVRRSFGIFEGANLKNSDNRLDLSFIIPGKSLAEFLNLIGEEDEPVAIELTRKHVIISFDNTVFFSRLIESEFWDYKRVLKNGAKTSVVINTHNFSEIVELAAVLAEDRQKTEVRLNFIKGNADNTDTDNNTDKNDKNNGILRVTSVSPLGEVCDECGIEIDGEDLLIGFNHRYLSGTLRAIKDEKILMHLESPTKTLIIMPHDKNTQADKCEFLYVIMPVKLRD